MYGHASIATNLRCLYIKLSFTTIFPESNVTTNAGSFDPVWKSTQTYCSVLEAWRHPLCYRLSYDDSPLISLTNGGGVFEVLI